jgi:hypothetical protein
MSGCFGGTPKENITLWIPKGASGKYAGHLLWGTGFKEIKELP